MLEDRTSACVVKATREIRFRKTVATLTSVLRTISRRAVSMRFVRISPEATSALVHLVLTEIHSTFAKNVTALSVNVSRLTSWSVEIAFWLAVQTVTNVRTAPNAFQSLVA